LAVAGQNVTAPFTDARPIAFKTVEYAHDVFVIVFDELLAETHDVGATSGALFCISLALSRSRRCGCDCEHYGKSNYATHGVLSFGSPRPCPGSRFCKKAPTVGLTRCSNQKRLSEDLVPIKKLLLRSFFVRQIFYVYYLSNTARTWRGASDPTAAGR